MATNVKQSPIPVVPRTMKIVNVDGTITRSGQQLLEQLQAPSAIAGTHGDRPNPGDVPEGSLYYENDRGVLYAATLGVWQYVAGTMFGTLSPDERPPDLGTHDAGFDFRGTDQPREFLWSQTEWIEVTAVQYGPHAARPDPATIVEGALYVESDRGGAIYQRETPSGTSIWQYLAGTMWGTLVPDQRPTGLGTHDAGFDFRTNVPPPQEFIWNQTAWVEVTPQANSTQIAYATSILTLTTAFQQVPGTVITLPRAGQYLVQGTFFFALNAADAGNYLLGQLSGGAPAQAVLMGSAAGNLQATVSQQWIVSAGAGSSLWLEASKTGGSGGSFVFYTHTGISALWVSP